MERKWDEPMFQVVPLDELTPDQQRQVQAALAGSQPMRETVWVQPKRWGKENLRKWLARRFEGL